jgi:hypothetical protein
MNGHVLALAILLIIAAIMAVATASIGIQCYNKCDSPKMNEQMPRNKTFLVINLIIGIVFLIASLVLLYFAFMLPSTASLIRAAGIESGNLKDLFKGDGIASALKGVTDKVQSKFNFNRYK